jgi:hypothetical protein
MLAAVAPNRIMGKLDDSKCGLLRASTRVTGQKQNQKKSAYNLGTPPSAGDAILFYCAGLTFLHLFAEESSISPLFLIYD